MLELSLCYLFSAPPAKGFCVVIIVSCENVCAATISGTSLSKYCPCAKLLTIVWHDTNEVATHDKREIAFFRA